MAEVILKGQLQDHEGRTLHPHSEAGLVVMPDGKSVEAKFAEFWEELTKYLPLDGGGNITGNVNINLGRLSISNWGAFSSGTDGHVMYAQNAYKNPIDNKYYFLQTHESMGAKGVLMRHGVDGLYFFDTGMIPTVADQEFTPKFRRLDRPDAELINGADLNDLTQNGIHCGNSLTNAPFGSADWWWVFVQGLTDNATNYVTQTAVAVNQEATYTRTRRNGAWGAWARLAIIASDGNSAYIPIPRHGPESARGGYVGYPDGGTMLYLTNETGGPINISSTAGVQINGQRVPVQYYSTSAPSASDGQDGDVWDVYV